MTLTELFTSIADVIRSRNQWAPEKIKATDFPSEIENACSESEMLGYSWGKYEGVEEGKQEEYDRFWDVFQENGNRQSYYMAFQSSGHASWDENNFRPKYDIRPITTAQYMFYSVGSFAQKTYSLKEWLNNSGVVLDMSQCKYCTYGFIGAWFTDIPYIDFSGISTNYDIMETFRNCIHLHTIDGIRVKPELLYTGTFHGCGKLENILFDGEIGNDIDFHWSPLLTVESLRSILTALSKNSTYASGKTITFNTASKAVIEADSECVSQLASAVSAGWTIAYS